jgi:ABC-type lipoprotein export system ATPase subunit
MIRVNDISKTYTNKNKDNKALENVFLDLPEKGLISLTGKSGSGKTTLLNLISTYDTPSAGDITYKEQSIFNKDFEIEYRKMVLTSVFQETHFIRNLSIKDNIVISNKIQGNDIEDKEIQQQFHEVDLDIDLHNRIDEISAGQKQRVTLVRGILRSSRIILVDEPTANLDEKTELIIFNVLKKISETKLVILVTHNLELAKKYSKRIITLKDGKVIYDVSNIKDKKESATIKDNNVNVPSNLEFDIEDWKLIKSTLLEKGELKLVLDIDDKQRNLVQGESDKICSENEDFHNISNWAIYKILIKQMLRSLPFGHIAYGLLAPLLMAVIIFMVMIANFNSSSMMYETFKLNEYQYIDYRYYDHDESYPIQKFTLDEINRDYVSLQNIQFQLPLDESLMEINEYYDDPIIYGKTFVSDAQVDLILGGFPQDNEILITDYIANQLISFTELSEYQDLIDYSLGLGGNTFIISGIIDTDSENYDFLSDVNFILTSENQSQVDEFNYKKGTIYSRLYFSDTVADYYSAQNTSDVFYSSFHDFKYYLISFDEIDSSDLTIESTYYTPQGIYITESLFSLISEKITNDILHMFDKTYYINGVLSSDFDSSNTIYLTPNQYQTQLQLSMSPDEILIEVDSPETIRFMDDLDFYHNTPFSQELYFIEDSIVGIVRYIIPILTAVILFSIITNLLYFALIFKVNRRNLGLLKAMGLSKYDSLKIFTILNLIVYSAILLLGSLSVLLIIRTTNNMIQTLLNFEIIVFSYPMIYMLFGFLALLTFSLVIMYLYNAITLKKTVINLLNH